MKSYDIVVIGGSAAGIPAAVTAKRHYPDKSVGLVRKEEKVLIPCGIPYIFGTVMSPEKNLIPDSVLETNGIELVVDEAVSIDPEKKMIATAGGAVSYDKLILATGSTPLVPPIPGADKQGVYTAKKDVPYLRSFLEDLENVKKVLVLGGGFIGVEFADELRKRNLDVTIVEMLPHCLMLALESEFSMESDEKIKSAGVSVLTESRVEEILGNAAVTGVKLSNGQTIDADMLMLGIGVRPETTLAESAGLAVEKGGVSVNEHMRTSDESIFACGDCAAKNSFFTGRPSPLKLASVAAMEARIAGANLYTLQRKQCGVIGVFSTIIDGTVFGAAGLTEENALQEGYKVVCGATEQPNRHPGGMPGMVPMKVKLVFDETTGELLGGGARGGESVGELVNTLSACIQKKMTVEDMALFQLGTHPAVTASPIAYHLVNAAELAIKARRNS